MEPGLQTSIGPGAGMLGVYRALPVGGHSWGAVVPLVPSIPTSSIAHPGSDKGPPVRSTRPQSLVLPDPGGYPSRVRSAQTIPAAATK